MITKRFAATLGLSACVGVITAWVIPNWFAYPVGAGLACYVAWIRHRKDVCDL